MDPAATEVAVIGAGVMGGGIAGLFAASGFPTTLVDVEEAQLVAALDRLNRIHGSLPPLRTSTEIADAAALASIVVEAVPEQADVKTGVLRAIASVARTDALIATNTSTMSITALGGACDLGELVGIHFFNPPHRMQLIEVVIGRGTSETTRDRALAIVAALGKVAIVVNDSPGFATSRLGVALGNEAMRMVEEGVASAADIDTGMRLGYGHPMGPLELADLVGLDARLNNTRSLFSQTGLEQFRPPEILERLVQEGRLGRKSGAGFFDYDGRD